MKNPGKGKERVPDRCKRSVYAIFSCLMACVCLFLTACQKQVGSNSKAGEGGGAGEINEAGGSGTAGKNSADASGAVKGDEAAAPESEWVYVPEIITVEDDRASYGDMQLYGDDVCYISMLSESGEEEQKICRYSLTQRELTQVSFQWPMEEKILESGSFVFNPDHSVWLIVNAYSADYSQFKRYLCRFDPEGKNLVSRDVTEEMGRESYVGDMAVDGQGRIYIFTSEYAPGEEAGVWLYTGGGDYQGMVSFGAAETVRVVGAADGEDGSFYVCISKGESPDHCTMLEVDFEGKRLTEVIPDFPNINGLCIGKRSGGNYDLLLYDNNHAYGYNFPVRGDGSGQTPEELFTWTDSDINGWFVEDLQLLEDGRYYVAVEDWENKDRSIVLLRKTKAEDVVPKKSMTLAAVNGGSSLTALAVKFNRSQEQYHLELKNYDSLTDLYNAILTKENMDIIDLSGVNVESLLRQGIFEDLRPYLERSESLAPSDFVEGILDTYTIGGTLVGIPDSFTLKTLAGDRALLGGEDALTLEGILEIAERNPEALPIGETTKEEMMRYLMTFNQDAFIDWETGECRFDSAQFQALLELANRFPDSVESFPEEDSLPRKIHDGKVLFAIADIYNIGIFQLYQGMFGETAACVGFPTAEGKCGTLLYPRNAFGITAMSQCKEGAWAFIESVLEPGEIAQMEPKKVSIMYRFPARLPSLKKTLDIIIDHALEEDREWAEEGKKFGFAIYDDGWTIEFHALTQEEVDTVLGLVKDARPYFSAEEDQVIRIISEEAAAYYSGQKRAEDVAGIIQNRVRLYVNESR